MISPTEEALEITFLEEEPGDKCDNRRWDCPNEAVWQYTIIAYQCDCGGPRNACTPCKDKQEKMLEGLSSSQRYVLCNAHYLPGHISFPSAYR